MIRANETRRGKAWVIDRLTEAGIGICRTAIQILPTSAVVWHGRESEMKNGNVVYL